MVLAIIAVALLSIAVLVSVGNWFGAVSCLLARRKGNSRNFSLVPIVTLALVAVAAVVDSRTSSVDIQYWLYWLVALTDLALWQLLYLPIFLYLNRQKPQT